MSTLLALVAGFASGVLLRSLFVFGWPVALGALLLALVCGVAFFLKRRRLYLVFALFLGLFACGVLRADLADTPPPAHLLSEVKSRVALTGTVLGSPDIRDANQRITISVSKDGESTKVLVIAQRYPVVSAGEQVEAFGTLALPQPFSSADEGERVFRYDKYLEKDDIRFLLNFASLKIISPAPWWSISGALGRIKSAYLGGLGLALPEPYASLAGGIVIGGKQGLGKDILKDFILAGIVQIIVLSGYNVMVVAEGVMYALGALRLRRKVAAIAGALAIVLFVLIAGAAATAVRAALMAMIALYARATGRTYAAGRALLLVVFLMLLWNPLLLAFDPGFGLSVVAVAGLIWLSPLIELRLVGIKSIFWRSMIATTVAAQIAVLPLLLYDNGILSLVAVPANLLVLPVVPAAMAASAIAGLAGMAAGVFALPLAFPAYLANAYIIFIARILAALPFAAFHLPVFPFWLVLLAYAVLIAIYFARSKRASATAQFTLSKKAST